ncbi:MAG TPA: hypothetical protein VD908_17080 [Cytophagales bacterium]|nr:hypothetical protein [Cytophagales bacterium]
MSATSLITVIELLFPITFLLFFNEALRTLPGNKVHSPAAAKYNELEIESIFKVLRSKETLGKIDLE